MRLTVRERERFFDQLSVLNPTNDRTLLAEYFNCCQEPWKDRTGQ